MALGTTEALLQILRESWRRGATGEHQDGPDFGPELEEAPPSTLDPCKNSQ